MSWIITVKHQLSTHEIWCEVLYCTLTFKFNFANSSLKRTYKVNLRYITHSIYSKICLIQCYDNDFLTFRPISQNRIVIQRQYLTVYATTMGSIPAYLTLSAEWRDYNLERIGVWVWGGALGSFIEQAMSWKFWK